MAGSDLAVRTGGAGSQLAGSGGVPADDRTVIYGATPTGPEQLSPGVVLNNAWRVGQLIGRGGMSEVYRGENLHSGEPVAIKVLLPHLIRDPNTSRLLLAEAHKMSKVRHPAVIRYVMIGEDPALGVEYLVMDLIEGATLASLIDAGAHAPDDLLGFARRMAEGLGAVHGAGVFMRDLSPDNILAPNGRLGEALVIDFGVARDTDPSQATVIGDAFAGKLGWVAPEQFGEYGGQVGPWTDIYSLGLILAALGRGRVLDMGVTISEAVVRRRGTPDLSDQPFELRGLLATMLDPDPARRFRSMDEVMAALAGMGAVAFAAGPTGGTIPPDATVIAPSSIRPWAAPAFIPAPPEVAAWTTTTAPQPQPKPAGARLGLWAATIASFVLAAACLAALPLVMNGERGLIIPMRFAGAILCGVGAGSAMQLAARSAMMTALATAGAAIAYFLVFLMVSPAGHHAPHADSAAGPISPLASAPAAASAAGAPSAALAAATDPRVMPLSGFWSGGGASCDGQPLTIMLAGNAIALKLLGAQQNGTITGVGPDGAIHIAWPDGDWSYLVNGDTLTMTPPKGQPFVYKRCRG